MIVNFANQEELFMLDIFKELLLAQDGTNKSRVLTANDKHLLRKARMKKGTDEYLEESKRLQSKKEQLDRD